MPRTVSPLLPSTGELLRQLGERLRLARLRRRLSAKQVAERTGMAPMTLRSVERGGAGVTIGAYLAVMQVLGVELDLDLLAKADPMGRALQDARLPTKARKRPDAPVRHAHEAARPPLRKQRDRIHNSRFISARTLAALVAAPGDHRGRAKRR